MNRRIGCSGSYTRSVEKFWYSVGEICCAKIIGRVGATLAAEVATVCASTDPYVRRKLSSRGLHDGVVVLS